VTTVLDLEPPARQIITLASVMTDDMLPAPTPCGGLHRGRPGLGRVWFARLGLG